MIVRQAGLACGVEIIVSTSQENLASDKFISFIAVYNVETRGGFLSEQE